MCVKLSPFIDSKHLVLDYVVTLLHDPLQITVGSSSAYCYSVVGMVAVRAIICILLKK